MSVVECGHCVRHLQENEQLSLCVPMVGAEEVDLC